VLKWLKCDFLETGKVLGELATASSRQASMASWVLQTDEPRSGELLLTERVNLVQNLLSRHGELTFATAS
jgi:hypothetical protein